MLSIILLILKIFGFLILGILAFALILILVLFLCPFVYRAELSADNSLDSLRGKVRFHWLMHLVSGEVSYEDGNLSWTVRAAWKRLGSDIDESRDDSGGRRSSDGGSTISDVSRDGIRDSHSDSLEQEAASSDLDVSPDTSSQEQHRTVPGMTGEEPAGKDSSAEGIQKRSMEKKNERSITNHQKKKKSSFLRSAGERIRRFPGKIKYTFHRICDKIKTIRNKIKILKKKKEKLTAFIQSEIHQAALARLLKELKRLLRFLCPGKGSIDLEFGFSDPALTGYALAGISMAYPWIGSYTQITPDFEHKVFRGSLFIKGRIRLLYGLIFLWNMFLDRNVRITFRHIRKFRL